MARDDKKKATVGHDFVFLKESDLNDQIKAFAAEHEAACHEILAMDARKSLGPTKVRVTFRVIEKPVRRGEKTRKDR